MCFFQEFRSDGSFELDLNHDQGSYTSPISVVDANHLLNVGKHHDQGSYTYPLSVVDTNVRKMLSPYINSL